MKKIILITRLLTCLPVFAQDTKPFNPFYYTRGIVIDSKNNIFICGMNNKVIRITPDGQASDFAGNPNSYVGHKDGKGPRAMFDTPKEMAMGTDDTIYLTDFGSIRKIAPDGTVETYAGNRGNIIKDGPLSNASFRNPEYITVDKKGNVFVSDRSMNADTKLEFGVIRKISVAGEVTTLKDAQGNDIRFDVHGLACDDADNIIACDLSGRCIKKISAEGIITVIAGQCGKRASNPVYKEGDVKTAELMTPLDIAISKAGEFYFSDQRLHRIIKVANNKVSTVAGNGAIDLGHGNIGGYAEPGYLDGPAKKALFNFPVGIAFDNSGNLFIVDQGNKCIRKLSTNGMVSTFYK